jgi:hypothetical protein
MAKKKTASKFADKSTKAGLLVRECPECHKFHHPRAGSCPNCGHEYPPAKKSAKRKVKKKVPGAKKTAKGGNPTAASRADDRLHLAVSLVSACRGDVAEARRMLDTIEQIRKL